MSVWNGERYLAEAVESVLGQSFRDFEFIIIDDGSTDGSLKILEDFAARDERMHLVSRENRGLISSLNEGIALSRGEFVARMDADDVCLPGRFADQVAFLRAHLDCVVLGAEVMMIDADGDPLCLRGHMAGHDMIDRACLLGGGNALTHPVVMMRKSALQQIGPYDPEMIAVEDLDLFLRLCEVGKAQNLPQVLLRYRQHSQSVNNKSYQDWILRKRLAIAKAIQRRGVEGYVRSVFCGAELRWFQENSFADSCAKLAAKGGHLGTALKHLRRSAAERGFKKRELRLLAQICAWVVKQKAGSLFLA
jgi:glycosyltransferase involved in cell wall biosynthesis